ncbi:MAG: hypothetical protein ACRD5K_13195 [Candidatus Acidiferrales bacterium]
MEILWPALGITLIVVFVFFVLAQHWSKLLGQQSRAIRQLSQRVQNLEDMADPELRRRLGDAAPVPLEQVFTFSLRLGERFWSQAVRATEKDRKFIHDYGTFLASVKLERWRSHTVAIVSEIVPARKSAGLQTRRLDYYPNSEDHADVLTLWELALARPSAAGLRPPSLELLLRGDALELRAMQISATAETNGNGRFNLPNPSQTVVLFQLPLDPARLDEYRRNDSESASEEDSGGNEGINGTRNAQPLNSASFWHVFYAGSDETLGIEWELSLRDLGKKVDWERWHIWESGSIPVGDG